MFFRTHFQKFQISKGHTGNHTQGFCYVYYVFFDRIVFDFLNVCLFDVNVDYGLIKASNMNILNLVIYLLLMKLLIFLEFLSTT